MTARNQTLSAAAYAERAQALRGKLYRMAFCYVKNEQDALDIVSDAVMKGYLKRESLKEPAYFETWMTRIVINCALDLVRGTARQTLPESELAEIPAPETGAGIEERIDLYAALDTLPAEEKTLIILKFFEDQRFSDIARTLGIPENTAKTRLYRALARLRAQFCIEEGQS